MKISLPVKNKKILAVVPAAIIIWLIGSQFFTKDQQKIQYQTVQAEVKNLISSITVTGNVTSGGQAAVYPNLTGIVEKVFVENGDVVKAGDNLFSIKSSAGRQEIASSYAQYQSAVSSLKLSEQNKLLLEAQTLQKKQVLNEARNSADNKNRTGINPATKQKYTDNEKQNIDANFAQAKADFNAAEVKYREADVSIKASRAQVNSAWLAYEAIKKSTVTAPIAGTVANLSISEGQLVSGYGANGSGGSDASKGGTSVGSGGSSGSGADAAGPALYIGDFSKMSVKASVNEADLPKIKIGQKATISLDAFPELTYAAAVSQIDRIGSVSSGVVTYNVYITFVSPSTDIAPGMTASAGIQTSRRDNVLAIPSTALKNINDQTVVRVMDNNGKIKEISVQTGLASDSDIEVTDGLKAGQQVVYGEIGGNSTIAPGGPSPFGGGGFRPAGFGGSGGGMRIR